MTDIVSTPVPGPTAPIDPNSYTAIAASLQKSACLTVIPGRGAKHLARQKMPYISGFTQSEYETAEDVHNSPSPNQIGQWATDYTDAVPLLLTGRGEVPFVVIDYDDPACRDWVLQHFGPTPLEVLTSRGGHLYYQNPEGVRVSNQNGRIGPISSANWTVTLDSDGNYCYPEKYAKTPIDVKALGGYVVAPGASKYDKTTGAVVHTYKCNPIEGCENKKALPWFELYWASLPANRHLIPTFPFAVYEAKLAEFAAYAQQQRDDNRKAANKRNPEKKYTKKADNAAIQKFAATFAKTDDPMRDARALIESDPFFQFCTRSPKAVSWNAWTALALNLHAAFGQTVGNALFHEISALNPDQYNQEHTEEFYSALARKLDKGDLKPHTYLNLIADGLPIDDVVGNSPAGRINLIVKTAEGLGALLQRFVYITTQDEVYDTERKFPLQKGALVTSEPEHGKAFLTCPLKRCYDGYQFEPRPEAVDPHKYNTFDPSEFLAPDPSGPPTLTRAVLLHLCNGDEKAREHVELLEAWRLRNCGLKSQAVLYCGSVGTGKGFFNQKILGTIYGSYFVSISNSDLESNFNSFLEGKLLGYMDEADSASKEYKDRTQVKNRAKGWITETNMLVNRKGKPQYLGQNYVRLNASSNERNPIDLDDQDRRWTVLRQTEKLPVELSRQIAKAARVYGEEKAEAARYRAYLDALVIPVDYDPMATFMTDAKQALIDAGVSTHASYFREGSLGAGTHPADAIYADYRTWCDANGVKPVNRLTLMRSHLPDSWASKTVRVSGLDDTQYATGLAHRSRTDKVQVVTIPEGVETAQKTVRVVDVTPLDLTVLDTTPAPTSPKASPVVPSGITFAQKMEILAVVKGEADPRDLEDWEIQVLRTPDMIAFNGVREFLANLPSNN